ncbi:hypothetical protein D3C75_939760 [compost metagenome]
MPLRPGLPVGRSAFADALQVGNQGMRIRTGHSLCQVIGVGRVTVGVQVGKVRSVHGEAPCKAIGSRHARGGGRYVVRIRVDLKPAGANAPTHRPP